MKLLYLLTLFILLNKTYGQNSTKEIPDSITYELINTFCNDYNLKRIYKIPVRYIYDFEIKSEIDTNEILYGTDIFLNRIKEIDTIKYFLNDSDYSFFRKQIIYPEIKCFDPKKVKKTHVKKRQSIILQTNSITLPLFSIDLQKAIITGSYWGMSRNYLYQRNQNSKQWEFVYELWQDGS